jgi:tetratricopeptide (TPR) repeat protein
MILLLPSQEIEDTDDLIGSKISKMPISVARSGLYTHWLKYYLAACNGPLNGQLNGQLIDGLRQNEQVSDGYAPMKPHTSIPLNVLWQWMLQSYAEQITQDPNNVLLYWDRSWLYGEMKAFDQAIADLTQAISLAPTNAVLWSNRGVMYYHAGDFNSALFDFNYSIGLNSKVADVFMNRAYVLFNLQCVDEALRDLTRANQLFS